MLENVLIISHLHEKCTLDTEKSLYLDSVLRNSIFTKFMYVK